MNNQKKNNYLIKNTLIFALGNLGSKVITFLLVPLYTKTLSTFGYGILDIIGVITSIGVPIITLNISEAVIRFLLDKNSDKQKILEICLLFSIFSVIISALLYPLFMLLGPFSEYALQFSIYIAATSISGISLFYIRGIEKNLVYSIISIIKTIIIGILSIVFLLWIKLGINGYLYSYIIAEITTIILCVIFEIKGYSIKLRRPDTNLAAKMIKYSFYLIPNSIMWWVINSMDRFMIAPMFGLEANGIYAVSSKLPSMVSVFTNIFNQAWTYSAVKENSKDEESTKYITNIYTLFYKFIALVIIFLIIAVKPLLKIYVGKDFYDAWIYSVPLLVGTLFAALGTFISSEYTIHKDSKGFLRSATVGAIVNFILNLILMPPLGVMGAAIATCLSYIAVFLYRASDIKKYRTIKYFDKSKIFYLITLMFSASSAYINNIILTVIVFIFFTICIFNFIQEINIKNYMMKIRNKFKTKGIK